MVLMGYTRENIQTMRLTGLQAMIGGFVAQLLQVYILAYFIIIAGATDIVGALVLTSWLWLGFVALTQLGGLLWENRAPKLFFFNAAYQLIQISIAAAVLVLVGLS